MNSDEVQVIKQMLESFESSQEEALKPVIDSITNLYGPEKFNRPEDISVLVGFRLDQIFTETVKRYFPDTRENFRYRMAIECWDDIYRTVGKLVENKHGISVCCMDCGRWIANEYLKTILDSSYSLDMTIDDKCYWKPDFGTSNQWIALCDGIVEFYRTHDPKSMMEAYQELEGI